MDISLHESAIYGTFVEKMCDSYEITNYMLEISKGCNKAYK